MPLPTLEQLFGHAGPLYVRKLSRKSHWGSPADDPVERLSTAVAQVFPDDPANLYSVYEIRSDADLHRLGAGLNGNRSSLREELNLVAFLPDEISGCGISLSQTAGDTRCVAANQLHFDLGSTRNQIECLCQAALSRAREAKRMSKSMMGEIATDLTASGCRAAVHDSTACHCDSATLTC